jgi:hypothetical protein
MVISLHHSVLNNYSVFSGDPFTLIFQFYSFITVKHNNPYRGKVCGQLIVYID